MRRERGAPGRGDVWILDLGQDTRTHAKSFTNITLIVPRDRVLPLLKGGDIHGTTLRSDSASARLIGSHLETLLGAAPDMDLTEAAAAVDAAALMIAGAWSRIREKSGGGHRRRARPRAAHNLRLHRSELD